jgi:hypothetical protein
MLDLRTLESKGWIFFYVEEIGRLKMPITPLIACIYARCINLCVNPRIVGVLVINMQVTTQNIEVSPHGSKHHVLYDKCRL